MSFYSSDLKAVGEFGPRGKLPDKNKDPKAWNEVSDRANRQYACTHHFEKTWNRYLEWAFGADRKPEVPNKPRDHAPIFEVHNNPVTREQYLAASREGYSGLLNIQYMLHDILKKHRDSFAVEWLSMGSQKRLKHILGGLVQFCQETDYELWRVFCPESTNSFLERDSGRGLLDLLTTFCPPNQSNPGPQEPILLSHPQFKVVMGFEKPCPAGRDPAVWDLIQADNNCTRSDFLCRMLFHIIIDTQGVEPPQYQPRKEGGWRAHREWYSQLPSSLKGFKKEALAAGKARWKAASWHCTSCGRPEDDLPQGTPFAFCVPCRGINRKVPYCNKDCQRRDWKLGNPPHKLICGKPEHVSLPSPGSSVPLTTYDQAPCSSKNDKYAIPLPDPGFIRSSALVSQIAHQSPHLNSHVDPRHILYVFMKPTDTVLFCLLHDTWSETYFRTFRNHAFRNGDSKAVAAMYKFLSQEAPRAMFPLHLILIQLCREYDIKPERLIKLASDIPVRELSKRDHDKFLVEMDSFLTLD